MTLIKIVDKLFKTRNTKLPVVCVLGCKSIELVTPRVDDYEEKRLDCRCYLSDAHMEAILIRDRPYVLVTIGVQSDFPHISNAPFEIRKRWLHYETLPDLTQLGMDVYNHYLANMFETVIADDKPLVTVFTATYKTASQQIYRLFLSLKEQTYTNWEWIIVDDSDDYGETVTMLRSLAKQDHRIQVFKPWKHSGVIGKVKNWACSLGSGKILLEVDHDDELTNYALDSVVNGFKQFPEAGFLYTDCAEVLNDGTNVIYRGGLGLGVRFLYRR